MCPCRQPAYHTAFRQLVTRRQLLRGVAASAAALLGQQLAHAGSAAATLPPSGTIAPRPAQTDAILFEGSRALQHAAAQLAFFPRPAGSTGSQACGDYILAEWARHGWQVDTQPFTYRGTRCRNLIARRGTGPVLIIGAHYDTRFRADNDPDPAQRNQPYPGANDGASGVAILLELARVLQPEQLGRTIWLVGFDAEDNGGLDGWDWIIGSRYMAERLPLTPQGMLLVDMVGDADLNLYYERNSTQSINVGLWATAAELGYRTFIPVPRYRILDDHIPFLERGIPAANMIDFDYPYWHTISDTLDKITAPSLETVGRTVQAWLGAGAPGLPAPRYTRRVFIPRIVRG